MECFARSYKRLSKHIKGIKHKALFMVAVKKQLTLIKMGRGQALPSLSCTHNESTNGKLVSEIVTVNLYKNTPHKEPL